MFGHSADDAWPRVRRCLASALTVHGHGADNASSHQLYTFPKQFFEAKLHPKAISIDYQQVSLKKGTLKCH
jgi:hypothetical protein